MILGKNYELPANGGSRISNSCIAAALASVGIGGRTQKTEHRKPGDPDRSFFSFHLVPESGLFPGLKTSELVNSLLAGQISMTGPWDEPLKLFMAGWLAVKSRQTFKMAAHEGSVSQLQLRRTAEGLCSLEPPRQGNWEDLRRVARDAHEPTQLVFGAILCRAMLTVGFAPLQFTENGAVMTAQSLTFPGLSFELCLAAYRELSHYNKAILGRQGVIPSPPEIDLPGARPGFHPFQFALQSLFNYAQIMDLCMPRTERTLFFKHRSNALRTALIDESAPEEEIDLAIRHARRN